MIYLVYLVAILIFIPFVALIKHKIGRKNPNIEHKIMFKIFPLILIVMFFFTFMCYKDPKMESANQTAEIYALYKGPMNGFLNTIGILAIWTWITASIILFLRPGVNFKTAKWYTKFISLPMLTFTSISLYPMFVMMQGNNKVSTLFFALPITMAALVSYSIYFYITDWNIRISKHSYAEVAVFGSLINFATMPPYVPFFFFGPGNKYHHAIDLSPYPRVYIYLLLIFYINKKSPY